MPRALQSKFNDVIEEEIMTIRSPLIDKAKAFRAGKSALATSQAEVGTACVANAEDLARVLSEEAGETDTFLLASAILHDILQTTDTKEADLVSVFGSEIAFVVAEVTDHPRFSPVTRKALRMRSAPYLSRKAKLIKLAEVIESVRTLASPTSPKAWSDQHKVEYFDWAERFVQAMGKTNSTLEAVVSAEIEGARLKVGARMTTLV
jgi:guanosine-3',5'-bis(diphosphate) 3'-pyrophosphohydrolase